MESITPEVVSAHNLTPAEFERIKSLMSREPSLVELGIFSVMWSEHCSYKSSRTHLRRLPTTGERIIVPPGENAGIVDIGDGWCAAFKIESHNHPSFIEPFQGAATGVGIACALVRWTIQNMDDVIDRCWLESWAALLTTATRLAWPQLEVKWLLMMRIPSIRSSTRSRWV